MLWPQYTDYDIKEQRTKETFKWAWGQSEITRDSKTKVTKMSYLLI